MARHFPVYWQAGLLAKCKNVWGFVENYACYKRVNCSVLCSKGVFSAVLQPEGGEFEGRDVYCGV